MTLLHWHRIFDDCADLDAIHARWHTAAQEHCLNPGYETPEYRDAILSFVATSTLPAPLKLAALLTCVSGFDFDLRLALGALDVLDDETAGEWPAAFADAAVLFGPCPVFAVRDPALANFAFGRLASLRDGLRWNGENHAQWRETFWESYFELACRWADANALQLAMARGARRFEVPARALQALAEGVHAPSVDAPYYTEGRSNADYLALIDRLCDAGLDLCAESATVLPAAARVDNCEMLEELVARTASLAAAGPQALSAAASSAAHGAVEWLIMHGSYSVDQLGAALIESVATLDETLTEMLLDAGADLGAVGEQALCTACGARPIELYNGATSFISQRADMMILLARRGADPASPRFIASLRLADNGQEVLSKVLGQLDLQAKLRQAFASAGVHAFGPPFE